MAITTAVCSSLKPEYMTGVHNFTATTGDVIKAALYASAASLGATTTAYSATNEVSGTGYTAGGQTVTNTTPILSGTVAIMDFTDVIWTASSITARGCLFYNSSKSNKAIQVHDFGADYTSTAGPFTLTMPASGASTSIVRLA